MMHRVLGVLLLAAAILPAQVVRLANHSGVAFDGWKRTTVDKLPPHTSGQLNATTHYVVGRQVGRTTRIVDIRCRLAPGEQQTHDLADSTNWPFQVEALGSSEALIQHFGGPLKLNGLPMEFAGIPFRDGAAWFAHLRKRVAPMWNVDVWVWWYPDSPAMAAGEAFVTCSNPAVPEIEANVPALNLQFGDALTLLPGRGALKPLIEPNTRFVDGQARAIPLHFLWLRHLTRASDWSNIGAITSFGVGAVGIEKLLVDGNPNYPPTFSARAWASSNFSEALRRLHTWEGGVCGPAQFSGTTGAQEDQVFVRGEAMLPDGVGAELVTYFSALKLANRPCHFLEEDGSIVDTANHPQLVLWASRPHWHRSVSPDRLGKPNDLSTIEVPGGWLGPDREHWFYNTVAAGARYTGSPACQKLLEHQAHIVLQSETLTPGWSTSGSDAARSVGWLGILVVHLHENLADRNLAARVTARWRAKVLQIYIPELSDKEGDWWDPRLDPRLHLPHEVWGVLTWQQSIGAYGLNLACRVVGPPQGRQLALTAAKTVLEHAFTPEVAGSPITWEELDALNAEQRRAIVWREWGNIAFRPNERIPVEQYYDGRAAGLGSAGPRWFRTSWHPPVTHVILEHEPTHEKALQVEAQLEAAAAGGRKSWFPPKGPR